MFGYYFEIVVFGLGLCVGSFLNVVIYRLPLGKSLAYPGSACPVCKNAIKFYDNIPFLSYLILNGKCRNCKSKISIRYPLVEIFCGVLTFAVFYKFELTTSAAIYILFAWCLLAVSFIDIDHRIIPNVISLPAIPFFLFCSIVFKHISFTDSLMGILIGGGSLFIIAVLYQKIKKMDGMGFGDIKLLAMIGAAIGWKGVLFTIFASSLLGTVIGVMIMVSSGQGMKTKIPFGPFLSIGAISYLFFGDPLIRWYLNFPA